jgi:hypothetical protein
MQNHKYWETDNHNFAQTVKEPNEDHSSLHLSNDLNHTGQKQQLPFSVRGSLGQFIERSTSAPPLSVIATSDDDAVHLLENVGI